MAVEVKLPKLAASMDDGVISKWLKAVGDAVKQGEPLFEVESDKVTTEVEAPVDGVLQRIVVPEGEKIDVGTVLAIIAGHEETVPETNGGGSHAASAAVSGSVAVATPPRVQAAPPTTKIFVTPRARKVADDLGIDLNRVKGTGPGGRILERDVLAVAPSAAAPSPAPVSPPIVPAAPPVVPMAAPVAPLALAGLRRAIAER
ncbi:MAG TPA: biotin/lipoyl-containing protein, partial [Chloroflexota bacterium]|nr:biotin/lipoyl-containing protein [Chloroflexota bacterium]